MKFRTFITPLAAVVGLVFVVGLALLVSLLLRNPLALIDQGGLRTPAALQFVPKQSSLVASVLVRPDRLTDMWEFLTAPNLRQATRRDIDQIKQTLLAGTGLTYDQDIFPWLGEEVTVAVVSPDLDQNPDNGQTPGYLIALSCQDSQAARAMLELFWQNRAVAGDALTFEEFAGNRLIYSAARKGTDRSSLGSLADSWGFSRLATTLVANQFVLVANHPDVLRLALNSAQSNDSNLASDRRYRNALRVLPDKRVGLLALSLPAVANSLGHSSPLVNVAQSLETLGESGDLVDWSLVSLGLTREGIVGDIALVPAPGSSFAPRQGVLTDLPAVVSYLPDQMAVTAVGLDLSTLWNSLNPLWQYAEAAPNAAALVGRDWVNLVDQSLAHDLLHGVVNEFALGVNPGAAPDWLFVTEQSAALETALHQVRVVAQAAGLGASRLILQDHPTTALARLTLKPSLKGLSDQSVEVLTQVLGLQAEIDDLTVLASSPGAMDVALKRWGMVPSPPAWVQQLSLFQRPNEGYIHINWPTLQSALGQQIARFRLWETAAKPVLRHLKQITLTSYGRTPELQTGRIFFQLSNQ